MNRKETELSVAFVATLKCLQARIDALEITMARLAYMTGQDPVDVFNKMRQTHFERLEQEILKVGDSNPVLADELTRLAAVLQVEDKSDFQEEDDSESVPV